MQSRHSAPSQVVAGDDAVAGVSSFWHTNTRSSSGEKHTQQRPRGIVAGGVLSSSWMMAVMCNCNASEGGGFFKGGDTVGSVVGSGVGSVCIGDVMGSSVGHVEGVIVIKSLVLLCWVMGAAKGCTSLFEVSFGSMVFVFESDKSVQHEGFRGV